MIIYTGESSGATPLTDFLNSFSKWQQNPSQSDAMFEAMRKANQLRQVLHSLSRQQNQQTDDPAILMSQLRLDSKDSIERALESFEAYCKIKSVQLG